MRSSHRTFTSLLLLAFAGSAVAQDKCPDTASPSFCGLNKLDIKNWMARIPDGRMISELSIPGTHESLAIEGGGLFQCNEDYGASGETLTAQLNAGIRAFDIRVRITDGEKFTIHHASHFMNANFDDVMVKLRDFLGAHKSEFAILRIKKECTGDSLSCKDADHKKAFEDIFRDYAKSYSSVFWNASVSGDVSNMPAIKDVRGKVVLAVLNGELGGRYGGFGFKHLDGWKDKSSDYVQDEYDVPNLGAIASKRDDVRRFLDKTSAGDKTKLYFNFCSGSSGGAHPWTVAGGIDPYVGVNPFLVGYIHEGTDVHPKVKRTGVMMMDFPGPDLVKTILGVNNFYGCDLA